jgi:DnaJ-class molecular chaperone
MEIKIEFEQECYACNGEGNDYNQYNPSAKVKKCKCCNGRGTILSDLGRSLLYFLNKYKGELWDKKEKKKTQKKK